MEKYKGPGRGGWEKILTTDANCGLSPNESKSLSILTKIRNTKKRKPLIGREAWTILRLEHHDHPITVGEIRWPHRRIIAGAKCSWDQRARTKDDRIPKGPRSPSASWLDNRRIRTPLIGYGTQCWRPVSVSKATDKGIPKPPPLLRECAYKAHECWHSIVQHWEMLVKLECAPVRLWARDEYANN